MSKRMWVELGERKPPLRAEVEEESLASPVVRSFFFSQDELIQSLAQTKSGDSPKVTLRKNGAVYVDGVNAFTLASAQQFVIEGKTKILFQFIARFLPEQKINLRFPVSEAISGEETGDLQEAFAALQMAVIELIHQRTLENLEKEPFTMVTDFPFEKVRKAFSEDPEFAALPLSLDSEGDLFLVDQLRGTIRNKLIAQFTLTSDGNLRVWHEPFFEIRAYYLKFAEIDEEKLPFDLKTLRSQIGHMISNLLSRFSN